MSVKRSVKYLQERIGLIMKCIDVINYMRTLAPENFAEGWDNVGLMIGDENREISKIMVSLDINDKVVKEAVEKGVDMIITHHPMIFKGMKSITEQTASGRRAITLIKNNIAVYSAHTNLDIAYGGTNSVLAHLLDLQNVTGLMPTHNPNEFLGKVGDLPVPMSFYAFSLLVKEQLCAEYITVTGNEMTTVTRVALCTGKAAGYEYMAQAKKMGCQVYITGDVGYHDGQNAEDLGLCLIDGTHYYTEVLIVPVLQEYLQQKFPDLEVIRSKVNSQTLRLI